MTHPPAIETVRSEILLSYGPTPSLATLGGDPALLDSLWRHARAAYLDNALPPLFKERLFTYLSRFCTVPTTVASHSVLLLTGRPAGSLAPPQPEESVLELLSWRYPGEAAALELHLAQLSAAPPGVPACETALERATFAAVATVFLGEPSRARASTEALRRLFGALDYARLASLMAFVRAVHAWSQLEPDAPLDPEVSATLEGYPALRAWLASYADGVSAEIAEPRERAAMERLAVGIAHHLQNLFAGILGVVEVALSDLEPTAPTRRPLALVGASAERGAEAIGRVLDIVRSPAEPPGVLDLAEAVEQLRDTLSDRLGPGVVLELDLSGPLPVRVESQRVAQLMGAIADNARAALPSGGRVSVRARPEGRVAELVVEDTGPGMDEATRRRALEPFFSTRASGQGAGLGLALVHAIVRHHLGSLAIEGGDDGGARLRIRLPLAEPTVGAPATILVVDDDELVRMTLRFYLEQEGFRVEEAASGADALAVCAEQPVDLVVSDVAMPQMTGPELAGELAVRHPEVPVVFVSAYPQEVLVRSAGLPPGARSLQKPFSRQALGEAVRQVLAGASPPARR
ncbi:MAG: response regulator [Myxococcota bacterium]